jgi:hypothetical protein
MPLILRDRVQETTTTLGTGTITLAGAVSGFQSFSVIGNGNTTYYTIVSQTSNEWEVGIGTYTSSGTTLSRDTVLESSNGGSLVNFSAGTKNVFVTYPAEKSVYKDASEDVTLPDTLTAATVAIDAPTTDATFTNDTGITGWVYSGKGFSVNAQESAPTGLFFKPDGTKMYVTGSSGDDVNEYNLGTAWDVTTASFVAVSTGITQDTAPQDLFFKDDGLTLFVIGDTNNTVYQYTLSVAWDITTATYSSKSFSVATQETTPVGMWFKSDGTTMYIVGTGNDTVYQYTLSTPWDISTASYASISFSVAAQDTSPSQVVLSADGTKMWVLGNIGDDINEYTLGTAWNISTATFVNNVYVGFQETTPTGLFIDSTAANRVYVVGQSSDTVFQYNTVTNTVDAMTDRLFVSGEGYVDGNTFFGSNVNIDLNINSGSASFGTTSISGGLTASSSVNFSANTANISIGTAQTTGALSLGGTTQTGILTVGQSTGAQTLNIGTGATTSATTKTINIGTAGVSGSTTNIAIGSAVSGSLGTTTIQAPTVNIGQTATQFRVTNTASAVNFFQVTGNTATNAPNISSQGSDTNIGFVLSSKGTGRFDFFTNNLAQQQFRVEHTASAVNFVQVTGAATGSGPVLSSVGNDTNIDLNLTTKGTGVVNLNTGAGTQVRIIDSGGTAVNRIHLQGQATGFLPVIASRGSDTNLGMTYSTQGTGPHDFYTAGTSFTQQFKVSHTASAVNYVQVTGAATGFEPTISAQGSDSSVSLNLAGKGASGFVQFTVNSILRGRFGASGVVDLGISSSGGTGFQISATTNQVNYLQAAGAIASSGPVLSAQGSDTNIDLNLTPKGTGTVVVNGPLTATSSIQNTRINPRAVVAGATSGSLTINGDTTDLYEAEGLTGAITFLQPSGTPVDGQRLIIRIKDNGTARGITWTTTSGAFRAVGVTLPTTTVLSKVTYVGCIYNATDVFWDVIAAVTQA